MQVVLHKDGAELGDPGVFRGRITFSDALLSDYSWPLVEIRGREEGPRLCVSAGVHVNEVSSIEAAIRLQKLVDPESLRGTLSIIPLINQPALYKYTEYNCPVDGKNINFSFPGDPSGTFSEVLCHAILHEWCAGADCYIDLHGGDLRERVSRFVLFQRTGTGTRDAWHQDLAMCFDADIVVGLPEKEMRKPGRPPTGFATAGHVSIMSEAGANGVLDEGSIGYHVQGVLGIAAKLGMIEGADAPFQRQRALCNEYLWVEMPVAGQFYADVEAGDPVVQGQRVGQVRDFFGDRIGEIQAPADGIVLWRITHPTLEGGTPALAIAIEQTC